MLPLRMAVLATLTAGALTAHAAPAETKRVLVLNLTGSGVAPELAGTLSDVLVSAVREQAGDSLTVIGQAEIGAMLSLERDKDMLGCADSASCLAEIGGALGAEQVIAGTLGKVGRIFVVSIRVIDAVRAQVLRHASERLDAGEEQLIEAVSQLGRHVVDPTQPLKQGYLRVREAGVITIDHGKAHQAPFDRLPLVSGVHQVSLSDATGRPLWSQSLEVPAYELIVARAPIDAPPPVTTTALVAETPSRWWLWTALGVVAVGGAASAGYVLTRAPSGAASGNVSLVLDR